MKKNEENIEESENDDIYERLEKKGIISRCLPVPPESMPVNNEENTTVFWDTSVPDESFKTHPYAAFGYYNRGPNKK